MTAATRRSRTRLFLQIAAALAVVFTVWVFTYRPDRPIPTIAPGSSSGPAFAVQVIRPRLGLPLGGILPPQLFGFESHLGFDSQSAGARIDSVGPGRIALGADGWDLVLVLDDAGQVTPASEVVCDLLFENRVRRVRFRPGDPVVGTFTTTTLAETGELSGRFHLEVPRFEEAATGSTLSWSPHPVVLHGSFDRLPTGAGAPRP